MKRLLLGVSVLSLFALTGCGSNDHGDYALKCTGDYAMTTDVCFKEDYYALMDDPDSYEGEPEISLCSETSNGEGEYYFYFEDGKVLIEFEEKYNEKFTEKYYKEMEDAMDEFKQAKRDCHLEKKGDHAVLTCKKYDVTKDFEDYNTKEKMKELMEKKLDFKCE